MAHLFPQWYPVPLLLLLCLSRIAMLKVYRVNIFNETLEGTRNAAVRCYGLCCLRKRQNVPELRLPCVLWWQGSKLSHL